MLWQLYFIHFDYSGENHSCSNEGLLIYTSIYFIRDNLLLVIVISYETNEFCNDTHQFLTCEYRNKAPSSYFSFLLFSSVWDTYCQFFWNRNWFDKRNHFKFGRLIPIIVIYRKAKKMFVHVSVFMSNSHLTDFI